MSNTNTNEVVLGVLTLSGPAYTRNDALAQMETMSAKGTICRMVEERFVNGQPEWDIALIMGGK